MSNKSNILSCVLSGLLLLVASLVQAEKTDVVILKNGDRMTGEIRKLDLGKLEFSTDNMGSVYIEWDEIAKISSTNRYDIRLEKGEAFIGRVEEAEEAGNMILVGESETLVLNMASVVEMNPLELQWWKRLKGSFDIGFNFARANKTTQLTLNTSLSARTEKHLIQLSGSSFLSDQEDVAGTTRNSLGSEFQRFFGRRTVLAGILQLQQNEELDLDVRALLGGIVGRYAIHTNKTLLLPLAGVVAAREEFADTSMTSVEAAAVLQFRTFQYDDPEIDIAVTTISYVHIPAADRFRMEFQAALNVEVLKNLYVGLNLYDDYDSNPPSENSTKNDYGVYTSVGWHLK